MICAPCTSNEIQRTGEPSSDARSKRLLAYTSRRNDIGSNPPRVLFFFVKRSTIAPLYSHNQQNVSSLPSVACTFASTQNPRSRPERAPARNPLQTLTLHARAHRPDAHPRAHPPPPRFNARTTRPTRRQRVPRNRRRTHERRSSNLQQNHPKAHPSSGPDDAQRHRRVRHARRARRKPGTRRPIRGDPLQGGNRQRSVRGDASGAETQTGVRALG